jgi:transaldolase/glucose-6-phosphate isomerase
VNNIDALHKLGQSLWYDNIQRSLLDNGALKGMIERGEIKGVTSNPSIFNNAIAKSTDYDSALQPLAWSGLKAEEIFWELAVKDIQDAADLFAPLYESTAHKDGYVSLEVSPYLARDTRATVREAKRLWQKVNRPNLMIKIPATLEGLPAIRETIAEGINVNVTLIFSLERYQAVIEAFLSGLEDRALKGLRIESIASVASFFISRVDSKVDDLLVKKYPAEGAALLGKAAIANAKLAYELFLKEFATERFAKLAQKGAQKQRPLWASTSTKNPNYRDVIYIEELIGDDTVNTVPPATLTAFGDHGKANVTIASDLAANKDALSQLDKLGVSMAVVTQELEDEGVKSFADAFTSLLESVETRRLEQTAGIEKIAASVQKRLAKLEKLDFVKRMYAHDPVLWTKDVKGQDEIRIRMDWLSAPWDSESLLPQLETLLAECRKAGFTHALLLGMGGSSLAPEVLKLINGQTEYQGSLGLDLSVLDSTNPDEVLLARQRSPLEKTLYIVASKSGTTGEINAFFQYFWDEVSTKLGDKAGEHFLAITDPGTKLDVLARERKFFKVINANPQVGGRNSALTAFGLVPAALLGIDVKEFLKKTQDLAKQCQPDNSIVTNPGVVLGALMAEAAFDGLDKLTMVTDSVWSAFGNWFEQLLAESSGKEGRGIVPVATEPNLPVAKYGKDRLFLYVGSNAANNAFCKELREANKPLLVMKVNSSMDLGSQFYLWEVATAVACSILGVNSFDQPDVQDAKTRTMNGIAAFKETGKLEFGTPLVKFESGDVYSNQIFDWKNAKSLTDVIDTYLKKFVHKGDYIAINAFLPRTADMEANLQVLRRRILDNYGNAVTLGFGPRFLHSTGQLHKGGPDIGVFIEFTSESEADMDIPNEGLTFGTMAMAQALGDYQALEARGRRLLRIHLRKPSLKDL